MTRKPLWRTQVWDARQGWIAVDCSPPDYVVRAFEQHRHWASEFSDRPVRLTDPADQVAVLVAPHGLPDEVEGWWA